MKLEAKIIHYLATMDKSELPCGGISPQDIVNVFDGCDSTDEAELILTDMERHRVLECIYKYSPDGCSRLCDVFQLHRDLQQPTAEYQARKQRTERLKKEAEELEAEAMEEFKTFKANVMSFNPQKAEDFINMQGALNCMSGDSAINNYLQAKEKIKISPWAPMEPDNKIYAGCHTQREYEVESNGDIVERNSSPF